MSARRPNWATNPRTITGSANTRGHRFGKTICGTAHLNPATIAAERTKVPRVIRMSDARFKIRFSCAHNCGTYAQRGTLQVSFGFAVANLLGVIRFPHRTIPITRAGRVIYHPIRHASPPRVHRMVTIFRCPQETTRRAIWPTDALRAVIHSYVTIMILGGPVQVQCATPSIPMAARERICPVSWPSAIWLALRPGPSSRSFEHPLMPRTDVPVFPSHGD